MCCRAGYACVEMYSKHDHLYTQKRSWPRATVMSRNRLRYAGDAALFAYSTIKI